MKALSAYQHIYFIGIGGIGMSALARYFKFTGKNVGGYDKVETPLTQQLEAEYRRVNNKRDASSEVFQCSFHE